MTGEEAAAILGPELTAKVRAEVASWPPMPPEFLDKIARLMRVPPVVTTTENAA